MPMMTLNVQNDKSKTAATRGTVIADSLKLMST